MTLEPNLLQAAFLGLIEGLTEFIPVSSTGHLILLVDMLGFQGPPGKVFEIVIQLGAILAVLIVYWKHFWKVLVGLVEEKPEAGHFVKVIVIAFTPALIIGAWAHDFIKQVLFNPTVVAISLITGGLAILLIERKVKTITCTAIEKMPYWTALKIGLFQCVAMIPGVSRSGATIMGALLMGVERKTAAEFSFFLAIPTMFAATVYDLYKNKDALSADGVQLIAVGFIVAFITAAIVVKTVVNFISRHGFAPFAYYRIALGSGMLVLLAA